MRSIDRRIAELMYLMEFSQTLSDARIELEDQTPHVVGHLAKLWTFPSYDKPDWYVHIAAAPRMAPKYRTKRLKTMDSTTIKSIMYDYATSDDNTIYTLMKDEIEKVHGYNAAHDYEDIKDRKRFKKVLSNFLTIYAEKLFDNAKVNQNITGKDIEDIVKKMKKDGKW